MPEQNSSDQPAQDKLIEEVASIMYAAALAFTNNIGRKGWAWESCDEKTKGYWRNIARIARNVFQNA